MADGLVQVAPDSTGKKVDTSELTVGSNTVERQRIVFADPTTAAALAAVQNANPGSTDYGVTTREVQPASWATAQVALSTSATLIASARTGRRTVTVFNLASALVWLGPTSGVTTTTGIPLQPNSYSSVSIDTAGAIYGILPTGASASSVAVLENY